MTQSSMPAWERRFRAPTIGFPTWPLDAPDRLAFSSNESGSWQLYAWDRAAGARRRVTDNPIGTVDGFVMADGEGIAWFDDTTGDEIGRWMLEAFGGGPARPLVDAVPAAWSTGVAVRVGVVALGTGGPEGFRVYAAVDGGPAVVLHEHPETLEVAGLSRLGELLCIEHSEHGDTMHPALRLLDPRTGGTRGEQWDGEGLGLRAGRWSPVPGDQRLAIVHERHGLERPGIWDAATGERRNARLEELPGEVGVLDWWPDGSALLVLHEHEGRGQLLRLDAETLATPVPVEHPAGTISGARVRPDGDVWYRISSGARAASVLRASDGAEVLRPGGEPAPEGRSYRSFFFQNPKGQRVHGFVAAPPGPGPHPIVMEVHGGPTWAYTDTFMPSVQAAVDHGYAVAMVNYRGSTGYGTEFRDALIGDPGFPEVEDTLAGLDALIAEGTADPARAIVAGGSWGGYITLLAVALHPDRWAAGVAEVPVADYPTAYADESAPLQAMDRTLFGGSPEEVPDLYRERSPLTYVDRVTAPLLIVAGDNDSRCPIRQVLSYVDALEARGHPFELYRFDAGHGSMVVEERIRQTRRILEFSLSRVPTPIARQVIEGDGPPAQDEGHAGD